MADVADDDTQHARRIMASFPNGEHAFSNDLAGLLYTLQTATACAESVLGDKLTAADIPWEDHNYDYYDYSLELLGVGNWVPTDEQRAAIGAMGFDHFWTNPGNAKRSEGEKHYSCGRPEPARNEASGETNKNTES